MSQEYSAAEVAKHYTADDCWVIINGSVLNVSSFLDDHPGGAQAILSFAGKDASEDFNMLHDAGVIEKYASQCIIGKLGAGGDTATNNTPSPAAKVSSAAPRLAPARRGAAEEKPAPDGWTRPVVNRDWTQPNNTMSLKPLQVMTPSNQQSRNSGGTADILKREREKASFDVKVMMNIIDGGAKKTARRRFILSPQEGTDVSDKYYKERHDTLRDHLDHFIKVHDKFLGSFVPTREDVSWMSENTMLGGAMMNHWGLFLPTLLGQASDEQQGWWLPRAFTLKMVGCYAQTELGHGSNVRGLQTTATFDKSTQEFILNTPTLQSIKWWPGALGKVSTHAAVYAQLILDGKEHGVHIFMCQIRDENHRPLPGIELGDVGPKLGDAGNDTSFMRLENVRVPRAHMFCRYGQVDKNGVYKSSVNKTNDKMHYATMMQARGHMVRLAGGKLAQAATIATRYSCVRQQGFVDTSPGVSYRSNERQIIDHMMQRYRVFKQLSIAYAFKFSGRWMTDQFALLESGAPGVFTDTKALGEVASTSAGLKALCTYYAAQGIEDCRKCCGGNGYLLNSGVAQLSLDYLWQTTAEGDFIVLMLQTARSLVKTARKARRGEPATGTASYLAPISRPGFNIRDPSVMPPKAKSPHDFVDLKYLQSIYKYRSLVGVVSIVEELDALKSKRGMTQDEAWNQCAVQLCEIVRCHCLSFALDLFAEEVNKTQDAKCKAVLGKLCALYALTDLVDGNWSRSGVVGPEQMKMVDLAVSGLLEDLRPEAVALVDAFDIHDRVLCSTIGGYDGNVYESLYEAAKMSQLNSVDPFEGYEHVLRPYLDLPFLKLRNRTIDQMEEEKGKDDDGDANAPMQAEMAFRALKHAITPDMVKEVGVSYRFDIKGSGGRSKSWVVDLKQAGTIQESKGPADCIIGMADADFVGLMSGKLDPMKAFMQGKLQVKGNVMAAQKLSVLTKHRAKL